MNAKKTIIKRALLSVSNKVEIVELAKALVSLGVEIISTGGTYRTLSAANIPAQEISDVTGFPEIMSGRVKTLHPKIHGGILGLRDQHADVAKNQQIDWIDLVVVNLYPFAETIQNPTVTWDDAIAQIDIGGPAMIRSAAKNMDWVAVVIDPADYGKIITELLEQKGLSFTTRKQLAIKAFAYTARYDTTINHYLAAQDTERFLNSLDLHLEKWAHLRYGENPHQKATAYQLSQHSSGILSAKQHQGKELSFNNITDADAVLSCLEEFDEPACVIVKHETPCGVAVGTDIHTAFKKAIAADSLSAFGGIVGLNKECDKETAEAISALFFEVVIAPSFTADALTVFSTKPNCRILELPMQESVFNSHEYRFIRGGVLFQDRDKSSFRVDDMNVVTKANINPEDIDNLRFAYRVVKHVKSNAIVIAKNAATVGIGAGQVSRIDAVDIAIKKASGNVNGAVLASDAFFPFRDNIDRLAGTGIRAIIQPGGSVRDDEVIAACNEYGIAMVFTQMRTFKH